MFFAFQTFPGEVKNLVVPCAFIMTVPVVQDVAAASAIVRDSGITLTDFDITKTSAQIPKNHSVVELPAKSKGENV